MLRIKICSINQIFHSKSEFKWRLEADLYFFSAFNFQLYTMAHGNRRLVVKCVDKNDRFLRYVITRAFIQRFNEAFF